MSKVEPMVKNIREYINHVFKNKNMCAANIINYDLSEAKSKFYMLEWLSLLDKICTSMDKAEVFVLSNEVQDALDAILQADGFAMPDISELRLPHCPMVVQTRKRGWDSDRHTLRDAFRMQNGVRGGAEAIGGSILLEQLEGELDINGAPIGQSHYYMATVVIEAPSPSDPSKEVYTTPIASVVFMEPEDGLDVLKEGQVEPCLYREQPGEGDRLNGSVMVVSYWPDNKGEERNNVSAVIPWGEVHETMSYIRNAGGIPKFLMCLCLPNKYKTHYQEHIISRIDKYNGAYDHVLDHALTQSLISILRAFAFTLVRTGVTHVPMQTTAIERRKSPTGKVTKRPRKYNFTTVVLNAVEQVRGRSVEPIEHRSAHLVRGHFKQRKTGLFWWNPFVRGSGKLNKREAYEVTTLEEVNG